MSAGTLLTLLAFAAGTAAALPPPGRRPPSTPSVPAPTNSPAAASAPYLPLGSSIAIVLDERVDSHTAVAGQRVRAHLQKSLEVGNAVLAAAGAPATVRIVGSKSAAMSDVDGSLVIDVEPIELSGFGNLPVRAARSLITIELTAGQQSTGGITDTVKDIFIPYHLVYRIFRRGRDVILPVGTVLRTLTLAAVDGSTPTAIVIVTPPPLGLSADPVHAEYSAKPFYTVPPRATTAPSPSTTPRAADGGTPSPPVGTPAP